MRYVFKRSIIVGVFLLIALSGCQNSPGGLFSPQSDIHVAGISPSLLQPKEASSDSEGEDDSSSSEEKPPTLPLLQIMFRITNGVSVFLEEYSVHYYTENGQLLAGGRFDHSAAISAFIQAPAINTLAGGGSSSSDSGSASIRAQESGDSGSNGNTDGKQSVVSDIAGYITLEVNSGTIYNYMTRGNLLSDDDITPVIARIVLTGHDINGKQIQVSVQTTISTSILASNSN